MDTSDTTLLERARAGDRQALEALLVRHERRVYRFGLELCRHPEDAQDVLQETLLAAARGIGDFRGASSFSTWLYAIARSFCIKRRRRPVHAPPEEESLDASGPGEEARQVADPGLDPHEVSEGRQLEAALAAAIGGLEPMYREVLVLRDVEGLTAPEAGEVLGLSVEAVKSRLHRARVAVRARLAPMLGGEPAQAAPSAGAHPCPDVVALFSRHLEGEISADLCSDMEQHLAGCPRCQARCDSLQRTLALCRSAPLPEVPPAVQASVKAALRQFLTLRPQVK